MSAQTTPHKSLLIVLCSLCMDGAQAQTPNAKTLGDMIGQAKRKQELTLNPPPEPKVAIVIKKRGPVEPFTPSPPPVASTPPLLWTITGVNNQLVAEIIYKESVHILRLHEGEREIGPWLVERYGPNGLYLVSSDPKVDAKKNKLFLPAPLPGTSLERYAAGLPMTSTNAPSKQHSRSNSELALMQDLTNIMPTQLLQEADKALPQGQPPSPPGLQ